MLTQLQQLARTVLTAALTAIIALAHNPRLAGVKKLVGSRSDWRTRIGGYRIVYEIDDARKTATILGVATGETRTGSW